MDFEQTRESTDIPELVQRIARDLRGVARDELRLAQLELTQTVKHAATAALAILLGSVVVLIGLALAFVAAVPALGALIGPLWLRLLIVALAYIVLGGAVVAVFVKRLQREAKPNLTKVKHRAQATVLALKEGLHHG